MILKPKKAIIQKNILVILTIIPYMLFVLFLFIFHKIFKIKLLKEKKIQKPSKTIILISILSGLVISMLSILITLLLYKNNLITDTEMLGSLCVIGIAIIPASLIVVFYNFMMNNIELNYNCGIGNNADNLDNDWITDGAYSSLDGNLFHER